MSLLIKRDKRELSEARRVEIEPHYLPHAEGSCLIRFGQTVVVCSATLDKGVPPFLRNTGTGWVTAEYGMLPRSTSTRMQREAAKGKQDGRTQEIQRLIGRSLRAAIDLNLLKERQIIIDCDVIKADGGTRTAAITGGYVALVMACKTLVKQRLLSRSPIIGQVAAISCGIVNGNSRLDLDYLEDSNAEVDANFVMQDDKFIEIQITAEKKAFDLNQMIELQKLAEKGIKHLFDLQNKAIIG